MRGGDSRKHRGAVFMDTHFKPILGKSLSREWDSLLKHMKKLPNFTEAR